MSNVSLKSILNYIYIMLLSSNQKLGVNTGFADVNGLSPRFSKLYLNEKFKQLKNYFNNSDATSLVPPTIAKTKMSNVAIEKSL